MANSKEISGLSLFFSPTAAQKLCRNFLVELLTVLRKRHLYARDADLSDSMWIPMRAGGLWVFSDGAVVAVWFLPVFFLQVARVLES